MIGRRNVNDRNEHDRVIILVAQGYGTENDAAARPRVVAFSRNIYDRYVLIAQINSRKPNQRYITRRGCTNFGYLFFFVDD